MSTASKPRRRWFQFKLRTMLVLMLLVCIGIGWFGVQMPRLRKQQLAAEAIERLGGSVTWSSGNRTGRAQGLVRLRKLLTFEAFAQRASVVFSKYPMEHLEVNSRDPAWLRNLPGYDLFAHPTAVVIYNNAAIEYLAELPHIAKVQIGGCGQSHKTDLEYLDELTRAEETFCLQMHIPSDAMSALNKPSRRQIPIIDNTPVTGTELKHIQGLTRLQSLDLRGAQVNDAELEHLKNMSQLESLDLKGTQVTDTGLQILQYLTALEKLSLECTQMTDTSVQYLKGMSQLRLLDLSHTQITDAGVEQLTGLTQLEVLLLTGTQVSDSSVKKLRKILPHCIIRH